MCGIVGGFWTGSTADRKIAVEKALATLAHRGPDDSGTFSASSSAGTLVIAQNRLSIIDLSQQGHQPMLLEDGNMVIVYNGEIYNYRELRQELRAEGWAFTTETDTEVLLKCWAAWGYECLTRLEGMFAFAVFDKRSSTLTCVRDAFGIKPFFYSTEGGNFTFASELAAMLSLKATKSAPNLDRAYAFLVHADYDSNDQTFVDGIQHLLPGTMLTVNLTTGDSSDPEQWWRPDPASQTKISFPEASEILREKFLENVHRHMRSDVPIGAALSGGVDSSAVVCGMRHLEPDIPIYTFSYIADAENLSEERWIDMVNSATGAIPHKVSATAQEFELDLDELVRAQGEPFGSTSIYAQYKVFQSARENGIVVTLDGQGADEILAGYNGFPGQRMLSLLEQGNFIGLAKFINQWSSWPNRNKRLAIAYLGRLVLPDETYSLLRSRMGRSFRPKWLNLDTFEQANVVFNENRPMRKKGNRGRRVLEQMEYNLQTRGIPHLLRHGDRNAMAFSIESRVPFLTIPLAEFLFSLPENYLISDNGETKSVFRAAMRGIVPDEILDRKDKIGFATPEETWFAEIMPKLREWLEDADAVPFLNRQSLIESFDLVMSGRQSFSWQVWRWINYVRWYRNFIG